MNKKILEVSMKMLDKLTPALKRLATSGKQNLDKLGKSADNINKKFKTFIANNKLLVQGLTAFVAGFTIDRVTRFFVDAAQTAETYNRQLSALAYQASRVGVAHDKLVESLRRATRGQVSQLELVQATNRAIALIGTQAIPYMDKLADSALKASQVMGISVAQAIDNLAVGIGRQSRLILDNLGVIISVTEANQNYAKELGKTADQLSEVEKKTAFMLEVTRQLDRKFGDMDVTLSATDGLRAAIADLKKEIGEGLLPAYKTLLEVTKNLVTVNQRFVASSRLGISEYMATARDIPKYLTITQAESNMAMLRQRMHMAQMAPYIVDKAQIQLVDELNNKIGNLKEQLRLLRDPEVIALTREMQSLEKQINSIINPKAAGDKKGQGGLSGLAWIIMEVGKQIGNLVGKISDLKNAATGLQGFGKSMEGAFFWSRMGLQGFERGGTPTAGNVFGQNLKSMGLPFMTGGNFADMQRILQLRRLQMKSAGSNYNIMQTLGSNAFLSQLLFSGGQGAISGGGRGMIASVLPIIGAAFGPVGGAIGGILGGLFGRKRRGETRENPVYVEDIKTRTAITELLNITKVMLASGTRSGIQNLSNQIKLQGARVV